MPPAARLTRLEGPLTDLDRTTQVQHGGSTPATTTHLTLFSLNGERVLLKSKFPAMLAHGDHVRVVGVRGQGQFTAIACKNLTTGWTTSHTSQTGVSALLVAFVVAGVALTLAFPLFIFMPAVATAVLVMHTRANARLQAAQRLLDP